VIKSMTGYGRQETVVEGKKISAEIKSVNHRYSDYSIKVPRYYGFLEDRIRKFVADRVARGKVDIFISIEHFGTADKEISVNLELAQSYLNALHTLRDSLSLTDDITVGSVARYSDIFELQRKEEDEEELWEQVKSVLEPAVDVFVAMREREGERIRQDLVERIAYMKTLAARIDERSPETVLEYQNRLRAKIQEVLEDREVDEARLLTEVAIFADKIAVNEEMVRLASHFDEFYHILEADEPAGRKLDFLIQEINREVNTTGSKANDIEIAKLVVTLKGEIEKLREQIQNIE